MVKKVINVGIEGNDASGDPIREAFIKTNENFNEIYSFFGSGDGISITALSEGPDETVANSILVMNSSNTQYQSKTIVGAGGIEINNSDPSQLVISSVASQLSADQNPKLTATMDANTYNIIRLGDPDPVIAARFTNGDLSTFAINKGYADNNYVNSNGDVMTGPLEAFGDASGRQVPQAQEVLLRAGGYNTQMLGPLILQRKLLETDDPLAAVTKEYVDLSAYQSSINLFVSTTGNDNQFDVPESRKGRSFAYAWRSVSQACRYAKKLIDESDFTIGSTVKDITYANGEFVSQALELVDQGDFFIMYISNDGYQTDVRDANDIRPGHFIKGKISGAVVRIEEVIVGLDGSSELYRVKYQNIRPDGSYKTFRADRLGGGEPLEYGNPVKDLNVSIYIESGNYYEQYPIRIPTNVSLIGDELRRTIIRPKLGRSSSWAIDTYFRRDEVFDDLTVSDRLYGYHYLTDSSTSLYNKGITVSTSGTVLGISGTGPWIATIIELDSVAELSIGQRITATNGTGSLGSAGRYIVQSIDTTNRSIVFSANDGTIPLEGTISNIQTTYVVDNPGQFTQAQFMLLNNREFIQEEVIAYVNVELNGLFYDEAKCRRDTGILIEALAYDMALGSNFASAAAARAYYRGTQSSAVLGADKTATLAAITYLGTLLVSIATDQPSKDIINARVTLMKNIINNGLDDVPALFTWPSLSNTTPAREQVRDVIYANREFIALEVGAFIEKQINDNVTNISSPWYQLEINIETCERDVRLIVDALCYNLLYEGNNQIVDAATAYYLNGTEIIGQNEITPTLLAYEELKNILFAVARDQIYNQWQTDVNKIRITIDRNNPAEIAANDFEANRARNLVEIIRSVLANDGVTPPKVYPTLTNIDTGIVTNLNTMISGQEALKDAVITYLNESGDFFIYNEPLCKRDVGLIVDAICFDLVYGDYYRCLEAANSYFESASSLIAITDQLTETSAAINHIYTVVEAILSGDDPDVLYQNPYPESLKIEQYKNEDYTDITRNDGSIRTVEKLIRFIVDVISEDSSINPPKLNNELDIFLMNEATIIRQLSCQEHGGFMCVLDPLGQILNKSPYVQTASSFSRSINDKIFAGGMFVDAFAGNLQAEIIEIIDDTTIVVRGLTQRLPNLPCSFWIKGVRFLVDRFDDWEPTNDGRTTVYVNSTTPDQVGYTLFADSSNLFQASTSIEFLSAGNNSMCSNDYTQLNDLGYGLVALNGGLIEAVSVFTYYNQASYYADTGGQIRSVTGSSAHGSFGLVSKGSYPLEIPDDIFTIEDMCQGASIYSPWDLYNNLGDGDDLVTRLSGTGTGATFNVTVTTTAFFVTVANGGAGYVNGNQFLIQGNVFGGDIGTNDLTITVASNSGGVITGVTWTGTIPSDAPVNDYYNRAGDLLIYVDSFTEEYAPTNGSELEVVFGNYPNRQVTRYVINNAQEVTDLSGVVEPVNGKLYRLVLASGGLGGVGSSGITTALANNTRVSIKQNAALLLYDVSRATATRPSTALVFLENPTYVNRVISIASLSETVGTFEWPASSVTVTIVSTGHGLTSSYPASYTNLAGTNLSGTGVSATFNVTVTSSGYTVVLNNIGSGYAGGNQIKINGGSLNGVTGINDLIITINTVNGGGGILTFTSSGFVTKTEAFIRFFGDTILPSQGFYTITVVDVDTFTVTSLTAATTFSEGQVAWSAANEESTVAMKENFRTVNITAYYDANIQPYQPFTTKVTKTETVTNKITTSSVSNLKAGKAIKFDNTLGGITAGTTYYVREALSNTSFRLATTQITVTASSAIASTKRVYVNSTASLNELNQIRFEGTSFGNILDDNNYYIAKIVDSNFIQLAEDIVTLTISATTATSNLITVNSTNGFIADNPIKFIGTTYGGITAETVYYIRSGFSSTQFQVSTSPGGGAVTLSTVTGSAMTAITCTEIYSVTSENGNMAGFSGGTLLTLTAYDGAALSITATNGSTNRITTSSTSTLRVGMVVRFSGSVPIGGIPTNLPFYVKTIPSGSEFTISSTLNGDTYQLLTQTGSMTMSLEPLFGTHDIVGGTSYTWGITGSKKIAVRDISSVDEARINYGIDNELWMLTCWRGRVHRITKYTSSENNGTGYAVIEIDDLAGAGLAEPVDVIIGGWDNTPNLKAVLPKDSPGNITVNISTVRATGHDMLDVGSGSYAQTNFPNIIYGLPDREPTSANEIVELTKGRVFYTTSDQDGNFKVGDFFKVDQGTGTVTFSSSIAISNLDGLGFKRGVAISEFSVDDSFFDNATDTVPTEQAIRTYVDRRLGLTHNGSVISPASGRLIPGVKSGFMSLDGQLPMRADMNLGSYKIVNLQTPSSNSDATNKAYVDFFLRRTGGTSRSGIESFTMGVANNGTIDMNLNKIVNVQYPTADADAANKKYVDDMTTAQNELRELNDVSLPNPISGVANNSIFFYNSTLGKFTNGQQSGDVLFTWNSGTSRFDSQIQSNTIINSDVNSNAAIDQSKLNMTLAGEFSAAPTGTAAQKQARNGLASFDSFSFDVTDGFVSLSGNGISLSNFPIIGPKTVIGNSSSTQTLTPSAISFASVVQLGNGLYDDEFVAGTDPASPQFNTGIGALVKTSSSPLTYKVLGYQSTYTGASGDNGTLVQRNASDGSIATSIINATTQFNLVGNKLIGFTGASQPSRVTEFYTAQGGLAIAIDTYDTTKERVRVYDEFYVMGTVAQINGNVIWHAGNDGAGSGLDADLLDGYTQDTANTANTIVRRDASGNFAAGTITANAISIGGTGNSIGTVTGGTWQASTIATAYGGTGQTTYTGGQLLIGNNSGTLTKTGLTGGTGVGITNGDGSITISIAQAVGTGNNLQFNSLGIGTGASGSAGDIRATGDITAFYGSSSDERLKTNILPISNAIEKILMINGYTYNWNQLAAEIKQKDTKVREAGLLAQELEKVLPEVVATNEEGYKGIHYDKVVALLVEGIKDQQRQIEELKSEIAALKKN